MKGVGDNPMTFEPEAENQAAIQATKLDSAAVSEVIDDTAAKRRTQGLSSSISKRWTEEHDRLLRLLAEAATDKNEIAFALRRTRAAIVSRAALLGVALPKKPRGSIRRPRDVDPSHAGSSARPA